MKTQDLIILGALGVGAYLLWYKNKHGSLPWEKTKGAQTKLTWQGPEYKGQPLHEYKSEIHTPASSIVKIGE